MKDARLETGVAGAVPLQGEALGRWRASTCW